MCVKLSDWYLIGVQYMPLLSWPGMAVVSQPCGIYKNLWFTLISIDIFPNVEKDEVMHPGP